MFLAMLKAAFSYLYRQIKRFGSGTNVMLDNRRALQQLHQLDDRTLADIGIVRASVTNHELWSSRWDSQLGDPYQARRRLREMELQEAVRFDVQPSDPVCMEHLDSRFEPADLELRPCSATGC